MNENTEQTLEQQYPSLDLAYTIAIASYESATKRIDAVDGRIQTLLAFALGVCLAIPTLAKAQNISFRSGWFCSAIAVITLAIGISVYARMTGKIKMLKPKHLWQGWLHLSTSGFKKDLIFFAAEDYEINIALLTRKWRLSVLSMIIFALALVCSLVGFAVSITVSLVFPPFQN